MNSVGQIWHLARLTLGEHLVFGKIGLPLGETAGNSGIGIIPKFIRSMENEFTLPILHPMTQRLSAGARYKRH